MIEIGTCRDWANGAIGLLQGEIKRLELFPSATQIGQWEMEFMNVCKESEGVVAAIKERMKSADLSIYIIELGQPGGTEKIRGCFREAKEGDKEDKLPRDNIGAPDTSLCLYVGSSLATKKRKQTLASRIGQHLNSAPRGTYALKLSKWASNLPGGIIVRAFQFDDGVSHSSVLAIEDYLSDRLKPLFGKRGQK